MPGPKILVISQQSKLKSPQQLKPLAPSHVPTCHEHTSKAPAVSISRSVRAVGSACPSLVGKRSNMCDQNATRDVTAMLSKSGLALQIKRDVIASRLEKIPTPLTLSILDPVVLCFFSRCYVLKLFQIRFNIICLETTLNLEFHLQINLSHVVSQPETSGAHHRRWRSD